MGYGLTFTEYQGEEDLVNSGKEYLQVDREERHSLRLGF
jgi:hypothetical protein